MKPLISVREYARLTTEPVPRSMDCAQVPASAFDWLCRLNESFNQSGARLIQKQGKRWLKLDSHVGVIETPCGTRLEILPKHVEAGDHLPESRKLLRKMILVALDLPTREVGVASLELFQAPLSEWVMSRFLAALDKLIKRGLRFDYQRVEEEQRFLRGQLNVVAQMRHPPGRQHHFQIRHDIFLPDRPENRLLKLTLEKVCAATQEGANWRLANELRGLLTPVPASRNVAEDFRCWQKDRLMAHYRLVKPWCELILNQNQPLAITGEWQGISLLYPMEKLFERYVAAWLRRTLPVDADLIAPAASEFLCVHDGGRMFRLEPDLLVVQGAQRWVLDTKWKRLDSADKANKYGLSQADFYQLYAYGQKYLQGRGELLLIYPRRAAFTEALPLFDLGGGLTLRVLPFDLTYDVLMDSSLTSLPLHQGWGA